MTPLEHNSLAFQSAVVAKLPMLRRVARRKLSNHEDAEDAVQDALLLAHKNLAQFRGESSLSTWLVTIVVNCARMQRRRNSRLAGVSPVDDLVFELADPAKPADLTYSDYVERRRMMAGVRELSPSLRAPLLLWLQGSKIQTIAATLHCAEGTVKASLSRAKAKLRKRIRAQA